MAIVKPINLTEEQYNALESVQGSLSKGKAIIMLVKEHHELAKIKLEMAKKQPQETISSPVIYTHIKDKKQKTRFEV